MRGRTRVRTRVALMTAVVLLASAGLMLGGSSAVAAPEWSAPVNISSDTITHNQSPQIAVDGRGGTHVLWKGQEGTVWNLYYTEDLGSGWSEPVIVSTGTDEDPDDYKMVLGPDGSPHVVWHEYSVSSMHILYSTLGEGGWSAPVNLSSAGVSVDNAAPDIAVDGDGAYVVFKGTYSAAIRTYYTGNTGTGWSVPVDLSSGTTDNQRPQIGVDSTGNLHVVWYGSDGSSRVFYTTGMATGLWTAPVSISGTVIGYYPALAVDDLDGLHVMWEVTSSPQGIHYVANPGTGWSTPVNLAAGMADFEHARMAVDPAGPPHVVWSGSDGTNKGTFYTTDPGSGWTTPLNLDPSSNTNYMPEIAVGEDGYPQVVWVWSNGASELDVWYSADRGGGWSAPVMLSECSESYPVIAVDPLGNPCVAWDGIGGGPDFVDGIFYTELVYNGAPWYLAEGSTDGGMETFVLVQNPNPGNVTVDVTFMTGSGVVAPEALNDVIVPADSRVTFKANDYVTDFDVSTRVTPAGGNVICERSVYGNERTWAHDSIGVTAPSDLWFLAEGSTDGGMETFVLVQNPNAMGVTVDLDFMTGAGVVPGPQGVTIPGYSRVTFKANDYVTDYDVSTAVMSLGGDVICERSVYGNERAWAHDSIGVTVPSDLWFLAEGSTDGGMETFVLVQNPYSSDTQVGLDFMTGAGVVPGPQGVTIPAYSRVTFKVNDYVTDYNVSTAVSGSFPVVAERSVYGNDRAWAHDSIGTSAAASEWFLAEGSTDGGMETFVLVQNPNGSAVTVDLGFMTGSGYAAGPQDVTIPGYSRVTFKVNDYVTDYNVSTRVTSTGGGVICERSMYGNGRTWATDSIGYPR